MALATLLALPAQSAVWYVNAASTAASPNGQSWATAYPAIQPGVDAAASGDEVWVAAESYTSTTAEVVSLKSGVTLYGGFAGTETAREQRDWASNITIIDRQQARRCVTATDATSTVDGFVLQYGKAEHGSGMHFGTAANCTFLRNTAPEQYSHGGGMYGGTATNCTFAENSAFLGGAMFNGTATGCTFLRNATARVWSCSTDFDSGYESCSWARGDGGGMYDSTAANCTFIENSGSQGGGMRDGTATNCTFTNNAASDGGGMCWGTATNCTFSGNTASQGGGMYNGTAVNCMFTCNSAVCGGGTIAGTATNCTFTGNSAEWPGGGMYDGTAANCIIWGNGPAETFETKVSHSCLSAMVAGTGNIVGDPRFVNPREGDFRLRADSPCIDTGTPKSAPPTDLLGRSRPQGAGVEMGAYEYYTGDDAGAVDPPAVLRVNAASTTLTPDGLTWETAFPTLQTAADRSGYGGEIWVAEGTYTATAGKEVLKLLPGTSLFGGFVGTETAREPRDGVKRPTVIDGQGVRRCVSANGASLVDGFTIRNGAAEYGYGGGLVGGTASNCTFMGNSADYGGGMSCGTAADCTFTGNTAVYGGGMHEGMAMNCRFAENTAEANGGGMNAGIATNCIFSGNAAKCYGGGMRDGTATNCTFTGNASAKGGGVSYGAAVNCSFCGNSATSHGGGLLGNSSNRAVNCVFGQNSPDEVYGDIAVSYSCLPTARPGEGNMVGDPRFVNAAACDLHLQPGSPCIDTGTADGAPATDIMGVPRPQGTGFDMGAYEMPVPVSVPDVTGLARSAAHALVAAARLYVRNETAQYHPTVPVDQVISQSPAADTQTTTNTPVDLVISKGQQPVPVPEVVGQTQAAAAAAIAGAGLVVGTVTQGYSATVPVGTVVSQSPVAGTQVLPGLPVDLVISRGVQPSLMPDVLGQSQAQAVTSITTAGLALGLVTRDYSDTVAAGNVISQSPEAGMEVPPGTVVSMVVSLGPAPAAEGEPVDADTAKEALAAAYDSADTNGDGALSFDEAVAAVPGLIRPTFDALDTDSDGQLTPDELGLDDGSGCAGCQGGKGAFSPTRLGDLFLLALAGLGLAAMSTLRRP
jgi:beta-lactam-binding protein with PASTA domain